MTAVEWGGSDKVIYYRSCHYVNLIDDYVVSLLSSIIVLRFPLIRKTIVPRGLLVVNSKVRFEVSQVTCKKEIVR